MKLWIARSENGLIAIYKRKPIKKYDTFTQKKYWHLEHATGDYMCLADCSFPEVTFENSPQEVELKLIKQ